jgi:hypothetical protein
MKAIRITRSREDYRYYMIHEVRDGKIGARIGLIEAITVQDLFGIWPWVDVHDYHYLDLTLDIQAGGVPVELSPRTLDEALERYGPKLAQTQEQREALAAIVVLARQEEEAAVLAGRPLNLQQAIETFKVHLQRFGVPASEMQRAADDVMRFVRLEASKRQP